MERQFVPAIPLSVRPAERCKGDNHPAMRFIRGASATACRAARDGSPEPNSHATWVRGSAAAAASECPQGCPCAAGRLRLTRAAVRSRRAAPAGGRIARCRSLRRFDASCRPAFLVGEAGTPAARIAVDSRWRQSPCACERWNCPRAALECAQGRYGASKDQVQMTLRRRVACIGIDTTEACGPQS